MSKELDFLLHQARFVGGLDPHTMPPSGVASHLRTLASAVMAYDEFNPAAPSASPEGHVARVANEAGIPAPVRPDGGAAGEMLAGTQRCDVDDPPSPDAGDDTSASACQRCGKPGDFRMGDFHHIWAQDEWDCVASDGPGVDHPRDTGTGGEAALNEGSVPDTSDSRQQSPRSTPDVGEEHGICRLECQHEGACWDGDRVWLREGVTFRPSEDSATPSASDGVDWKAELEALCKAWGAGWDCSADPGHMQMENAQARAWRLLHSAVADSASQSAEEAADVIRDTGA